jgi:seryl-tRNA synthetase
MLTINQIRENSAFIIERLKIKNFNAEEITSKIIRLDSERREIQTKTDSLQNEMNNVSKTIGTLMQQGK